MCGIIKTNKKNLKTLYKNQEHRGSQSYGMLVVSKKSILKKVYRFKEFKEIDKILKSVENSDVIFFHHRFATSTPNFLSQTHPIRTDFNVGKEKYTLYTIHNGIIRNCDELRKKHLKNGKKYTTDLEKTESYWNEYTKKKIDYKYNTLFNDSESIGVEIASILEKKKILDIQEYMFKDIQGMLACFFIIVDKDNRVVKESYYRSGNPIKYNKLTGDIGSEVKGMLIEENKCFNQKFKRLSHNIKFTYDVELSDEYGAYYYGTKSSSGTINKDYDYDYYHNKYDNNYHINNSKSSAVKIYCDICDDEAISRIYLEGIPYNFCCDECKHELIDYHKKVWEKN